MTKTKTAKRRLQKKRRRTHHCTCQYGRFKMLSRYWTLVRVCWQHASGGKYGPYSGLSPRYFGTADFALNEVILAQRVSYEVERETLLHELGHILAPSLRGATGWSEPEADLTVVWFLAAVKALEVHKALWRRPTAAMLAAAAERRRDRNF